MRIKLVVWLALGLLFLPGVSGVGARMAGDFEIPAKRVVKPVEPVRAPAAASSRTSTAGSNRSRDRSGSRSFTDRLTGIKFVKIPQGCFEMGQSPGAKTQLIASEGQEKYDKNYADELPRHRVCVDGFWLAEKEVTVALWRRFIKATDYKTDAERDVGEKGSWSYKDDGSRGWVSGRYWRNCGFTQAKNHPVTCVSFNDVEKFIAWLNREGRRRYRLPSEAEWEYACRGGTTTIRFWGNDPDAACAYANVADQTEDEDGSTFSVKHECRDGFAYTAPVGSFKPNPFGLYDMLGNVWEWCADRYSSDYYKNSPVNNPQGPASGALRVFRGGSWNDGPARVRAANRGRFSPAYRDVSLGFRLALSSGQE